uniref:Ubiquinol oxidase n=2 Tax=Ostreococcus sp. 'lucimarinus' TaxID=242159 RepID=A0A7R9T3S3_9CHLO
MRRACAELARRATRDRGRDARWAMTTTTTTTTDRAVTARATRFATTAARGPEMKWRCVGARAMGAPRTRACACERCAGERGARAREGARAGASTGGGKGRTFASSTSEASARAVEVARDEASEAASAKLAAAMARSADSYMLFHPQYDLRQVENVKPAHRQPRHVRDYLAYGLVQFSRWSFDKVTGYTPKKSLTTDGWLMRFIFLETVAGVPGMVGAMLRHMMSLRTLKRDHGWIHTLLEEAENERMHLLTFLKLREPGLMFRLAVLGAQGVFFNAFFLSYLISPRTCHRFVGYLEEEAVRTYTHALHDIDGDGPASEWATMPAPKLAIKYWRMPDDATVRDLIIAVRADEASHSHVNHTLSSMGIRQANPFHVGHTELPENFVEPPAGFVPEHCR